MHNWLVRLILLEITRDCLISLQVAIVHHRAFREESIGFTSPYLVLCLAIFSGGQSLSLVDLSLVILIKIPWLLLVLLAILLIGLIQIFVAQRYVSFQLVDLSLGDLG